MGNLRKEKYGQFIGQKKDVPVFFHPWWLDAVCGSDHWDVILAENKGGEPTGVFPYFRTRLKFLPVIANPPLTPYLGPWLFYPENLSSISARHSFEQKTLRQLEEQIPKKIYYLNLSFHPSITNWYPFYWRSFRQTTRYTYLLSQISDEKNLWTGYSQTLRRQIKEASNHWQIKETVEVDTLYGQVSQSLARQGMRMPFTSSWLLRLVREIQSRDMGQILEARNEKGEIAASILLLIDREEAYCLALGKSGGMEDHNAVKLLLHESIIKAAERVSRYNFEGSMVENVERVFRSFGGERLAYFNLSRYRNRFLRALLIMLKKGML